MRFMISLHERRALTSSRRTTGGNAMTDFTLFERCFPLVQPLNLYILRLGQIFHRITNGTNMIELLRLLTPPDGSIFFYACSGQRKFSTVRFYSGFGLWVRVGVFGSVYHDRFPNYNPNLNHNHNRNLTLSPILTPNSS